MTCFQFLGKMLVSVCRFFFGRLFVNSDAFLGSFMVVEHVLGQNLISSKESLCTNEKTSWKKRHVENVQVKYIK